MNVRQPSYSQREPATSEKREIFHLRMKIDCRHKSLLPTFIFVISFFFVWREQSDGFILYSFFLSKHLLRDCVCVCYANHVVSVVVVSDVVVVEFLLYKWKSCTVLFFCLCAIVVSLRRSLVVKEATIEKLTVKAVYKLTCETSLKSIDFNYNVKRSQQIYNISMQNHKLYKRRSNGIEISNYVKLLFGKKIIVLFSSLNSCF